MQKTNKQKRKTMAMMKTQGRVLNPLCMLWPAGMCSATHGEKVAAGSILARGDELVGPPPLHSLLTRHRPHAGHKGRASPSPLLIIAKWYKTGSFHLFSRY